MWSYELSLNELILIDCTTKGQLLSMSEMSIRGPANYSEEDIPCSETGKPKKSSTRVNSEECCETFKHQNIPWWELICCNVVRCASKLLDNDIVNYNNLKPAAIMPKLNKT